MKKTKLFTLILLFGISIIFPNISASTAMVNAFEENSIAAKLSQNDIEDNYSNENNNAAWLVAAAGAIALAYATGYALGTVAHHAYNFAFGTEQLPDEVMYLNYNANDFTKFDN